VFAGSTADPSTVASQVQKVRERFGITDICWRSTKISLRDQQKTRQPSLLRERQPDAAVTPAPAALSTSAA
jgi:hypothetical protein